MKRRSMIAAAALLTALPILAAKGPGRDASRLDFLAGYLSLTETQKTQAAAIFTAASTASETARGQLTAAQDALKTAIKANAPDADLDRLSAAIGAIHGQTTAIQAKASARFYALLTAEQKTKFDALDGRKQGRR